MKRTIFIMALLFMVLMCRTPPIYADMDYNVDDYMRDRAYRGAGTYNDPLWQLWTELDASLISSAGATSILLTPGTAPTAVEGTIYYDDSSNVIMLSTDGTTWTTVGLLDASSYSLDTAYNNGIAVTVDGGAVALTATDAANNVVLALDQEDIAGTVNVLTLVSAGDAAILDFDQNGSGGDIDGSDDTWSVTKLGVATFAGLVAGASDITLENAEFIDNGTNNKIIFDSDTSTVEDFAIGLGANTNIITFSSGSGAVTLELGALDDVNGVGNIYFDSSASQITLAANEAADDLLVQVTGAFNASLDLRSAGTGADAVKIYASAGGLDVDTVADTIHIQNASAGDTEDITIALTGATNSSIILTSSGNAGDAMSFITTSTTGDFNIDSADEMDIDSVGSILIDISEAAADFRVDSALGSVYLEGAQAAADAVVLYASNAAGGIDVDAGTGGIAVDITGAADFKVDSSLGSIYLDGGEAAVDAIKLDASNAAGGVDIDAGTGGATLDSDGVISIDAADDLNLTLTSSTDSEDMTIAVAGTGASSLLVSSIGTDDDAISIQATGATGGIDIDATNGGKISIISTDDLTLEVTAGATGEDLIIQTTGATDNHILIDSEGTSANTIALQSLAGGLDIDAKDDVIITVASSATDDDLALIQTGAFNAGITLAAAGTGDDAIDLAASAGGVDISGVKSVVLTSTEGSADSVQITSTNGGIDITNAGGIATEDIDITSASSVNITAQEGVAAAIVIATTGGGAAAETIDITNDQGTAASATTDTDAAIQIEAAAGGISLQSGLAAVDAIRLETDGAAATMILQSITSTAASVSNAQVASIQLYSEAGGIGITSDLAGADAVRIEAQGADGQITIQNVAGTTASATTDIDAAIQLYAEAGGIGLNSALAGADAIRIETSDAAGLITIQSIAGTGVSATTAEIAAIQLYAPAGGIGITSGFGGADAIRIESQTALGQITVQNIAGVGASAAAEFDASIQLYSEAGGIGLLSKLNADDSIRIETNGGVNENITIRSNLGTGLDSIYALSDAGGIELEATTNTDEAAISLDSTLGGVKILANAGKDVDIDGGQVLITSGHNIGDAILIHANGAGALSEINLLNDEGTDAGAIDLTATLGGITMSAVDDFIVSLATNATDDDMTFQTTGADDTHIELLSDGTSENSITITATGGNIDIVGTGATGEDLDIESTNSALNLSSGEAQADAISFDASHTDGGITVAYGTNNMTLTGTTGDFVSDSDLFSIDGTGVSNISITANAIGEDFTVKQDGSVDASLLLMSDGTNISDALIIDAIAGGMDIDAQESITIDIAGGTAGTADIILTNTPGTDAAAIYLNAVAGGMKLHVVDEKSLIMGHIGDDTYVKVSPSGTPSTEFITIVNAAGTAVTGGASAVQLTSTAGGIDLTAQEMFTVNVSGGTAANSDIILTNTTGDDEAAISLVATAGGVKIAGNAAKDIDIDGGQINLKSVHAVANGIVIDADGAASGTAMQISTTDGAILIDADGATYGDILMETVDDVQMTIGGHFRIVDDDLMAFGTGDDVTLNYDEDGNDDLQIHGPVSFETTLCKFDSLPTYSSLGSNATPVWGGAATAATGDENVMMFPEATFVYHIIGDGSAELGPQHRDKGALETSAFDISFEEADGEGVEIVEGDHNVGGTRTNFKIGTDAFYLKVKIYLTDSSGIEDLWVGFRLLETFQNAVNTYNSFAMIGGVKETTDLDFKTETYFNAGSLVTTDLSETNWADTTAHELGIYVSAAKAVTYTVDGVAASGAAGFTWTDTDVVVPFLYFEHNTDFAELTFLQSWECGLQ